jgi:hypothetical protein
LRVEITVLRTPGQEALAVLKAMSAETLMKLADAEAEGFRFPVWACLLFSGRENELILL